MQYIDQKSAFNVKQTLKKCVNNVQMQVKQTFIRSQAKVSSSNLENWPTSILDHFHLFMILQHDPADPLVKSVFLQDPQTPVILN